MQVPLAPDRSKRPRSGHCSLIPGALTARPMNPLLMSLDEDSLGIQASWRSGGTSAPGRRDIIGLAVCRGDSNCESSRATIASDDRRMIASMKSRARPTLNRSHDETRSALQTQIDLGQRLLSREIRNDAELDDGFAPDHRDRGGSISRSSASGSVPGGRRSDAMRRVTSWRTALTGVGNPWRRPKWTISPFR